MISLRKLLIGTLVILGLIPLILSLILNVLFTERSLLKSKHEELQSFGAEIKRQISTTLTSITLGMGSISSNPTLTSAQSTKEAKKKEFARLAEFVHFCSNLTLLSTEGFVIDTTDLDSVRERDQTDWFTEALKTGKTVISRPEIDTNELQHGERLVMWIHIYQPVKDAEGNVVNVVKADMTFKQIWDILQGAKAGQNGTFILLDELGNTLYHPKDELILQNYIKLTGTDFNAQHGGEYASVRGEEMIFETQRLTKGETYTDRSWTLITRMKKSDAMAMASQNRWNSMAVAGFSIAITALVGTWLGHRIAQPVVEASEAARNVAAGDLSTKLTGKGFREMTELAKAFNHMTYQVLQHNEKLELMVECRARSLVQSQEELLEISAQLRAAYESTREGILVLNRQGRVVAANRHVETLFGLTAEELNHSNFDVLKQRMCSRFVNPEDFAASWLETQTNEKVTSEAEWLLAAPNEKCVSIYTSPVVHPDGTTIARLWMFRDITEQRQLEDSLRHAQKMDAVGRLAGGVAHDFNNLLQGILGNLFIVQQDATVRSNEEVRVCLHAARNAGQRAAELVKGLLGFSRQSHLKLGYCSVNNVLIELETLVRHTFDRRITMHMDLQDSIWGLHADSNQIEQVVMNMLVNAKDAMPNGGDLILTTRNVVIGPDHADLLPTAEPGEYVRISVSDAGMGMSEDVRSKIFEPFFTTKEQGKGTGLGLATSFGIIEQHGGWITCDSVLGHGTTFHIFLPRNESGSPALAQDATTSPKPVGGRETVLIVDDELVVRAVAEAILKKHGYNILTAADGEEALAILAREDGVVDLVLMDMTMPRLSGMDTFRHMRKGLAPNVPVVICSGYLVDLSGFAQDTGAIPNGFLQKPYDVEDMARTVRRVLDEAAAVKA